MDAETLTALQGSIAKWEAIVNGEGADLGHKNCPLCMAFIDTEEEEPEWAQDGCYGCPVAHKVGTGGCSGTPYTAWSDYTGGPFTKDPLGARVKDEQGKRLAQEELDFLKSLLPANPPSERPLT